MCESQHKAWAISFFLNIPGEERQVICLSYLSHRTGSDLEEQGSPHLEDIKAHPEVCTLGGHLQQGMICFQVELEVFGQELLSELQSTLQGGVLPGGLRTDIEQGCVGGIRRLQISLLHLLRRENTEGGSRRIWIQRSQPL